MNSIFMKKVKLVIIVTLLFSFIGCSNYPRNTSYIIEGFCLIITFASICIAIYFYHLNYIINRKNQELTDALAMNDNYKRLYEKLRDKELLTELTKNQPTPSGITPDINKLNNEQLFIYISDIIRSEKLFLNPKFGRQALIDRFHISSHRIGAAFSKGSHHKSLPDFVRECRLEYASQLLKQTDLSINDIITASGFSIASTFNHAFKEKYYLSPTEYREKEQELPLNKTNNLGT